MIVDRDRPASGVLQQRDVKQNRTRTRTRTRGSRVGGRRSALDGGGGGEWEMGAAPRGRRAAVAIKSCIIKKQHGSEAVHKKEHKQTST